MSQIDNNRADIQSSNPVDAEVERELAQAAGEKSVDQMMEEAVAPTPAAPAESNESTDSAQEHAPSRNRRDDAPRFEQQLKRGRISEIRGDDVFVELAGLDAKMQGIVPLTQFDRPPRLGSIMDFVVERVDEVEGLIILNREGAVTRATWEHLQRGAIVEARVTAHNKGGLELEMVGGIRAFMPASQIDLHHVKELEEFVGQKLHAVVQEIDRKSKKVVISRRQFLEQERAAKRGKLMESLEVGQQMEGTISSLVEYGAFIDIGGIDGLCHVSDLSYKHVSRPADVVKVGDKVMVKILKIDKEKERISLGVKQVTPDPWETVEHRYKIGEQITGRILRTADFGAFVEVETGVEGLLPHSELSWKRVGKPSDIVKDGDILRLVVLAVDVAKRRISLSLKQAQGDPWAGAAERYAAGTQVEGTIISTPDFGAFVELEPAVEGLVHISELSEKRIANVTDVVKVAEKHMFRVLEVDEENRRIRLSLKPARVAPAPTPARDPGAKPAQTAAPQHRATAKPPRGQPKLDKNGKPLKGGMDLGSIGLGQLKL